MFIVAAVVVIFCFTGFDVTCTGEFQGVNCSFDGCGGNRGSSCNSCLGCHHNYKIVDEVQATCNGGGYVKYECKKCNAVKTTHMDPLGHSFEFVELHRGICHEGDDKYTDGSWYDVFKCLRCNTTDQQYHYYGINIHYDEGEVMSLDENGCGAVTYTCLICGDKEVVPYGLHSEDSPQQQELNELYDNNSCGSYLKTCELCNRTVTKVWHKYTQDEYLVEPTETEYGLMKSTCISNNCSISDNKIVYSLIPPTGQN